VKHILFALLALVASCDPAYAAVFLVHGTTTPTYMGSSSDTKPITEVKRGSIFIETDTNHVYRWTGIESLGASTDWVQNMQSVTIDSLFPGEDTNLNRIAVSMKSTCAHYTADGVIKASAGQLVSIYVFNASANDDFIIYDNASAASGTKLVDALNVAAGYTPMPNYPAAAANGMYLDLTTAGSMQLEICWL